MSNGEKRFIFDPGGNASGLEAVKVFDLGTMLNPGDLLRVNFTQNEGENAVRPLYILSSSITFSQPGAVTARLLAGDGPADGDHDYESLGDMTWVLVPTSIIYGKPMVIYEARGSVWADREVSIWRTTPAVEDVSIDW
jgi:hypothetical protein